MFACLCMVLRLFSKYCCFCFLSSSMYNWSFFFVCYWFDRARFRDNRSSIFVNPKTLKVAQAQERRLSQLSQLSGSGLRTPRTPCRSPIHSVRSSRSSYGSNIYPIHDPVVMRKLINRWLNQKYINRSVYIGRWTESRFDEREITIKFDIVIQTIALV